MPKDWFELVIVNILIYGAVLGSILALLASGYSLVYGVAGVLNLAHGALYVLTGYIIYWFVDTGTLAYPFAIIVGLILITVIGALTYLALIKPIEKNEIAVMIVTFALAFFIQQGIYVIEAAKPGKSTGELDFENCAKSSRSRSEKSSFRWDAGAVESGG